jgi:hypothetical protein
VAKKIMEDSQTREASRQLNAYITMAKTRAALTGRPAGIFLALATPLGADDPATPDTNVPDIDPMTAGRCFVRQATQMYLAEMPPPYVGDVVGARAALSIPSVAGPWNLTFYPATGTTPDPNTPATLLRLVGRGNSFQIRFNYKGPWFSGFISTNQMDPNPIKVNGLAGPDLAWGKVGVDDDNNMTADDQSEYLYVGTDDVRPPIPQTGTSGVPFQILLPPKRMGSPLELTGGTCIDLTASGGGVSGREFAAAQFTVAVMFHPGGGIQRIWMDGEDADASGTIHFLVGKVEKMNDPLGPTPFTDTELSNLADPNSQWVSIGRANGSIMSSENMLSSSSFLTFSPVTPQSLASYLSDAREAAINREQMEGR